MSRLVIALLAFAVGITFIQRLTDLSITFGRILQLFQHLCLLSVLIPSSKNHATG
jgi:hypothetical protein